MGCEQRSSKFELFDFKRRGDEKRKPGERLNGDYVLLTVNHGDGSVMVWLCLRGGQGDLYKRKISFSFAKTCHIIRFTQNW